MKVPQAPSIGTGTVEVEFSARGESAVDVTVPSADGCALPPPPPTDSGTIVVITKHP